MSFSKEDAAVTNPAESVSELWRMRWENWCLL